jgi:hypothetical protein
MIMGAILWPTLRLALSRRKQNDMKKLCQVGLRYCIYLPTVTYRWYSSLQFGVARQPTCPEPAQHRKASFRILTRFLGLFRTDYLSCMTLNLCRPSWAWKMTWLATRCGATLSSLFIALILHGLSSHIDLCSLKTWRSFYASRQDQ